ncbi:MAG: PsiF family protein, partial [Hyphomicrobium sp.]
KAKSKACSAEADTQKLHGKARKAFRKTCMKKAA